MKKTIRLPENLTGPFFYVDCGARGDSAKKIMEIFPDAHYIGFEPDAKNVRNSTWPRRKTIPFFL